MPNNIFSTYSQEENRVTAAILAVLERLTLHNIDRILASLLELDFTLAKFENQVWQKSSVPDGRIHTSGSLWIETKRVENRLELNQINRHLEAVKDGERLLLLTPDGSEPTLLIKSSDAPEKIVWANFTALDEAIEALLRDDDFPPTEREAFLLRELRLMLQEEHLLTNAGNRVWVRTARMAWDMYKSLNIYTCAPNENILTSAHMAFYTQKAIQRLVPRIIHLVPSLNLSDQEQINSLDDKAKQYVEMFRAQCPRLDELPQEWQNEMTTEKTVAFLSGPDDDETVKLAGLVSRKEKGPWMQGRSRYVTLESLKSAKTTSELERA